MSLPVPLSVRLVTSHADQVVTRDTRDLQFRSTAPGGFASAAITLDRPLTTQPDEVELFGRLVVNDARTGAIVWDGQLEDPGRSAGDGGSVWQLTAIGPSSHTRDRTVPLIYIDRDLRALIPADNANPGTDEDVSTDPGDAAGERQALVFRFPQGLTVAIGTHAVLRYDRIRQAGQKLARVNYQWDAGRVDVSTVIRTLARTAGSLASSDTVRSDALAPAGGGLSGKVVVTNWTNGRDTLDVQLNSGTIGTVADDTFWVSVFDLVVRAMLVDATGADVTTGYTADTVLASEVVTDILGRLLPRYDGTTAAIAVTTFGIEQLAYPDGVTPAKLLDDLMVLEPAFYWAAWERLASSGKHRFEWAQWPLTPRYEADIVDGFASVGGAADLYNSVQVRYLDPAGEIRTTRRTQTVDALSGVGLTREAYLDLGDEAGITATQAQRAGDQWLAEHRYPPNAGTLTIGRPIIDLVTGRMAQPWEIRPGTLIRVRGVLPRVDALNPSGRDGVTVFRIVAVTFRASAAAAELELDQYPATVSRALADLQSRPVTRRR